MANRPAFLRDVKISNVDRDHWVSVMSNGLALQAYLAQERDTLSAGDLRQAMCVECEEDQPRWYILQRLKSALNEHRRREEDRALMDWFVGETQ